MHEVFEGARSRHPAQCPRRLDLKLGQGFGQITQRQEVTMLRRDRRLARARMPGVLHTLDHEPLNPALYTLNFQPLHPQPSTMNSHVQPSALESWMRSERNQGFSADPFHGRAVSPPMLGVDMCQTTRGGLKPSARSLTF